MQPNPAPDRNMLRHAVATVAYRGAKTVRDAPGDFAAYRVKPNSRTPVEIVAHMGDLFDWALSMAKGEGVWRESVPQGWDDEVARFFASIKEFDVFLAGPSTIESSLERLLQGPIADAMTHVGQLAMLRHLFGSPIRGENYFKADIAVGEVGPVQPPPRRLFD
jgi:hypothetical protein